MNTVGDDMPKQQQRCRELLKVYHDLGPAGGFGAMMIEQALRRADQAVISGDIVEIVRSYQELKELE